MARKKKPQKNGMSTGNPAQKYNWRLLIFMDVEQRDQIEAAKAQFAEIRLVELDASLDVRLRVHGYQLEPPHRLGSTVYKIPAGGAVEDEVAPPEQYVPTNSAILRDFVAAQRPGPDDPSRTAFLYWGHGRSFGRGVEVPGLRTSFRTPFRTPVRHARVDDDDARADDQGQDALAARARRAFAGAGAGIKSLGGTVGVPKTVVRSIGAGDIGAIAAPAPAADRAAGGQGAERQPRPGQSGQPLDLIILDSCFMGSLETAFEAHTQTRYLVASQTRSELAGLNLTLLLRHAPAAADGLELGREVLRQAGQLFSGVKALVLFDLNDPAPVNTFTQTLNTFVCELRDAFLRPNEAEMLVPVLRDTPHFSIRQFVDLAHFCERVADLTARRPLRESARALARLLQPGEGRLVAARSGEDQDAADGPSIYCPWFRASAEEIARGVRNVLVDPDAYLGLRLSKDTGWGEFVLALDHVWQIAREEVAAFHAGIGEQVARAPEGFLGAPTDPKNGGQAAIAPEPQESEGANLYLF